MHRSFKDNGLDKLKVFKTAMRIIIEDESCDIIENASLLLERIKEDYATDYRRQRCAISGTKALTITDRQIDSLLSKQQPPLPRKPSLVAKAGATAVNRSTANKLRRSQTSDELLATGTSSSSGGGGGALAAMSNAASLAAKVEEEIAEGARAICDEVIRDSIGSCSEPDYKMELAKLLSGEAKIELYIEHGKLSNAQRLACAMNRPDYVSSIIEEAARLNQNHVKTVCQLWLAKHESRNFIR